MKFTKENLRIALIATVVTLLIVTMVQNSGSVTLTFVATQIRLPLFGVILTAVVLGFFLGRIFKSKR